MSNAIISDCGTYRYRLDRDWATLTGAGTVLWIMLNPSTADATKDDPTIRRCINFTKAWGYAGLIVGNLFALRATDPRAIGKHGDSVGPENDRYLKEMAKLPYVGRIVAAWGAHAPSYRAAMVCDMLRPHSDIHCLGINMDGSPRHPLYLPSSTVPTLLLQRI